MNFERMEFVKDIRIKHFKSIDDVEVKGCKQFNLFVGRPNVGKSNLIEALTLFSFPYIAVSKVPFSELLRSAEAPSLFYNGDVSRPIEINIDNSTYKVTLEYLRDQSLNLEIQSKSEKTSFDIVDLKIKKTPAEYPIFKFYNYEKQRVSRVVNMPFLFPVSGDNLMRVVQTNDKLKTEFSSILKDYGLKLTFDTATQELKFIKNLDKETSFIVPFVAIADTLKRLLYYKAAIYSNSDSIIMFEEPEAHSYPPYIVNIVNSIIESKDNQFFITTHSPYVVNEFLEQKADVAIFVVDYKKNKTIVRLLSDDEIQRVYDDGIDMFFNTELFLEG